MSTKIVHIAPTPLVGAPGKIAWSQRQLGHDSLAMCFSDYPSGGPLAGFFTDKTILFSASTEQFLRDAVASAHILHIHNFVPGPRVDWIRELNQDACYVYQAHSPLREGPLYVERASAASPFPYHRRLVVGQYHGRIYPDYTPVPNIIADTPSLRPRQAGETLRVMFSPTHARPGRWNNKHSRALTKALDALDALGKIELVSSEKPVPPHTLMEMRRSCHVSIDEIVTGAFHQVSLEGLCAGNVTINRADFFSKAAYASFCDGEMPPFTYADDGTIRDVLLDLADDAEKTRALQRKAHDYFVRNCDPLRLAKVFDDAY